MSDLLKGKVALVTGGSSGIGRITALTLAKAGASVVISSRNEIEGEKTVKEIQEAGGVALFVKTDIMNEGDVEALVKKTVNAYGSLNIAFNSAGVDGFGELDQMDVAEYERIFNTNVKGLFLSMKYELRAMLQIGGGVIVNVSSIQGHVCLPFSGIYAASKHAVIGMTKSVALDYAKYNIRANVVSPGPTATKMFVDYVDGVDSLKAQELIKKFPMGRVAQPQEIANTVLFLASDQSSFITGQAIVVDGGFTIS